jgi:hypothetical protein
MASRRSRQRAELTWPELPAPEPQDAEPEYLANGDPLNEVLQETKGTE